MSRDRGQSFTEEEREVYAALAYDKKIEGWTIQEVADHLGIHRNTARRLIRHEAQTRHVERSNNAETAIHEEGRGC